MVPQPGKVFGIGLVAAGCTVACGLLIGPVTVGLVAHVAVFALIAFLAAAIPVARMIAADLREREAEAHRHLDEIRKRDRDIKDCRGANEELKLKINEVVSISTSLRTIAREVGKTLDPTRILALVADLGLRQLGATRISIWLLDPDGVSLDRVESRGPAGGGGDSITRLPVEEGIFGEVLKRRIPMSAESIKRDPTLVGLIKTTRVPSQLCAPMVVASEVLGLINIEEFDSRRKGQDEHPFIEFLSSLGAVALKNRELLEATLDRANFDGLTRLHNHRHFQDQLDQEIRRAERYGVTFSLILIDIDHFKKVNDTYGHQTGDLVLRETADCFRRTDVGPPALLARYGGEEFVVLIQTDKEGGIQAAEKLREAVEARVYPSEQGPLRVTISLGVATYPGDSTAKSDLIDRADQALSRAKKGGRNCVRGAEPVPSGAVSAG